MAHIPPWTGYGPAMVETLYAQESDVINNFYLSKQTALISCNPSRKCQDAQVAIDVNSSILGGLDIPPAIESLLADFLIRKQEAEQKLSLAKESARISCDPSPPGQEGRRR
jgi:hypothetical protein